MEDQGKHSKDNLSELRRRVELGAAENSLGISEVSALSPEKVQQLIQELQVHQIELEMQKEELRQTQLALEASRDKYSELYDFAPVGYVTLNEKGLILEANLTADRLLGVERQGSTKMFFSRFVSVEFGDAYYLYLQQVFETQSKQTCEIKLTRKDGSQFYAQLESVAVQDETGQFKRCRTVMVDITDRKWAEESLATANMEWERTFNAISDLVMVLDDQHKVFRINKAMADALGMTEQEAIGKSCFELVHGDTEPPAFCPHSQLLTDYEEHSAEVVEPRLGGIYDVRVSPLIDPNGQVIGSVHITRDISARKKAEEDLRNTEQRYRTLFEESRDGVYSVLRDGEITDANPSFCELFGYKREEMIGKDIRELFFDPADRPRFQKEIEKKGFVKDYAVKYRKRDGTEMDCLLTSSVYHSEDGGITGYRGIIRDVTDQKRLQRELVQAQKMESIGTLAGGIAHDFNNLLTVVLGFSELLLIGKDERDPSYADLQRINRAASSGADLVKRILAFSRKAEFNPRPLNLNHEIEQAKQLLTRTVPKMIRVELVLADGLPTVIADPTQVEQVLMNLAVNARDAMPDGGNLTIDTKLVTLDEEYCRLHLGAKPGDYVMISVSDTGHGIDHETLNHIFEPFYTTKASGEGTGLGLAMVYGMVKQHGGYIICYSEPGMGTTFKIYLPVIPIAAKLETPTDKPILSRGTETILLVDDEEMVRDLGKRILERSGYTVLTAANGKEAVNLYRKQRSKISLVILDLIMPEMGGKQSLEELLKIDPQVKVLIASGFAANGQTKEALETGARGSVGKPYNMKGMLQAVREALDSE